MSITPYLLGRHLTSVILTPQTVGTAGALSNGAPVTLTTVIDNLSESLSAEKEDIRPVNSTRVNNVVTSDNGNFSFGIIKVNNASDPNPLKTAILTNDIFKLTWTEGTGGSAKTVNLYASRGSLDTGIQGHGKQIATLTFDQIDAGTATYVVS